MTRDIRNPDTEELVAALAEATGETKTEAVRRALAERLERVRNQQRRRSLIEDINLIADHCTALPELDVRQPELVLGYDQHGLPH